MSFDEHLIKDARLVILRELAKQTDGRLNETLLAHALDTFGHRRSRDWLRTQLRQMAEVGAIRIDEAGPILVATLTVGGQNHLERRMIIEGIAQPSLGA